MHTCVKVFLHYKVVFMHFSRYTKGSDSRRSSKRSITSTRRYENNPIHKRRSRSPRNSPQPDAEQQQNHNSNDHVTIPIETIYRNLQETQQQPQILYTPNNEMEHYETLATYAKNGYVMGNEVMEEEVQQQQQQDETSAVDNQYNQQNTDSNDYENDDVPAIEASYITPIPDSSRTTTHTISNGNGQGLEYSDVANPSPPILNKNEHKKTNSVRKGKRPESSEEYTDPMHNGMANMKRLKASSVNSKNPDAADSNNSKDRHSSESAMGTPHRKDFEEWPIRAQGANAAPAHESDL